MYTIYPYIYHKHACTNTNMSNIIKLHTLKSLGIEKSNTIIFTWFGLAYSMPPSSPSFLEDTPLSNWISRCQLNLYNNIYRVTSHPWISLTTSVSQHSTNVSHTQRYNKLITTIIQALSKSEYENLSTNKPLMCMNGKFWLNKT